MPAKQKPARQKPGPKVVSGPILTIGQTVRHTNTGRTHRILAVRPAADGSTEAVRLTEVANWVYPHVLRVQSAARPAIPANTQGTTPEAQ